MAHPVRAMLPSTILVVVLLFQFQVADSSRPLSTVPPAVHRAIAEPHHHRDAAETGNGLVAVETTAEDDGSSRTTTRAEEGGAAAAALSATTTTLSARGKQQDDDGIGSRNGSRPAAEVQVLLRSRLLARRFLEGAEEGAADSAAKPSCRSSDVHNGCPPSEH